MIALRRTAPEQQRATGCRRPTYAHLGNVPPAVELAVRLQYEPGFRAAAMRAGYVTGQVVNAEVILAAAATEQDGAR